MGSGRGLHLLPTLPRLALVVLVLVLALVLVLVLALVLVLVLALVVGGVPVSAGRQHYSQLRVLGAHTWSCLGVVCCGSRGGGASVERRVT